MIASAIETHDRIEQYSRGGRLAPLFIQGDALDVLRRCPYGIFDFAMTSPPYWGKREYHNGGIGLEREYGEFIAHLLNIFAEVKRVLKESGSFWLNVGDSYLDKRLLGIPWRLAIKMTDEDRKSVV